MNARITWKSGMAFSALGDSNIEVPLDAATAHGGSGTGVVPMEMILMGLGGCTAMDVISILAKKRQEVTSFEVVLHANRADEHPKVFTGIEIEYVVKGKNIDPDSVARAVELSETKYCPGMAMLRKSATITTRYTVIEE
ncbi:MAG: OsmC family protein [Anaerolineaceae bacterium]|nr:OsmC family protein [Anaerolineaceae bacterium]